MDNFWSHSGSLSLGVVSTVVPDSAHKLFIGGLPNYLNDDQVRVKIALCGSKFRSLRAAEQTIDWAELISQYVLFAIILSVIKVELFCPKFLHNLAWLVVFSGCAVLNP